MRNAVQLDSGASGLVIDSAIHTNAPIVIESPVFPEITLNGYLICGDESALLMEVTGQPAIDFEQIIKVACDVKIYTDKRYCFHSTITGTPSWGDSRSIAITRPATLSVLDRRKSLRAKLAPSSKVALRWTQSETAHRQIVNLLNVSADGMACRLDASLATQLDQQETIDVTFDLPGHRRPFDLKARVTNTTPGSEGWTILGLQFVESTKDREAIEALRTAITRKQANPAESEMCV